MSYTEAVALERLADEVAAKRQAHEAAPSEQARAELIAAETILSLARQAATAPRP